MSCPSHCVCGGWTKRGDPKTCSHEWAVFSATEGEVADAGNCHRCGATVPTDDYARAYMEGITGEANAWMERE